MSAAFISAKALLDHHSPLLEQAVLTDFLTQGHFLRHIRRMRKLYAQRQNVLVEAVQQELSGLLTVSPHEAGMHLVGWLREGIDEREASQGAGAGGLNVPPLSAYALAPYPRQGLLLGYTNVNESEIRVGVQRLRTVLEECLSPCT